MIDMFVVRAPDMSKRRASIEISVTADKAEAATAARGAGVNTVIQRYPGEFGVPVQAKVWTGRGWGNATCARSRYVLYRPGWTTPELTALDGREALSQAVRLQAEHPLPRAVRVDEFHGVAGGARLVRRWYIRDGEAISCTWRPM